MVGGGLRYNVPSGLLCIELDIECRVVVAILCDP